ncbi:MAG: alpha/beta hydrolase [Thermoleophilaceae bacterium]|nr:alpha/beta hydrolase [Thermoleophilaceae bacterium]
MDEHFQDVGRGITLCYDQFGDPADTSLLLVMGLGTQMIGWREDFCRDLAGEGFHVTRFDNRDIGRSTHVEDLAPPSRRELLSRRFGPDQYDLTDMAADAAGLLRELGLGPAHVVGVSMGGMIAQTLAARHPHSVRSLTSIMSTTGARWKGQPALGVYRYLLAPPAKDKAAALVHATAVFEAVGTPDLRDPDAMRELVELSWDRDSSRAGVGRQLAAIITSGDRTEELRTIDTPSLVMHGTRDRLVNISGGRATAEAIPGARLVEIDGMGHDLPRAHWPRIIGAIAEHARAADGARAAIA